MDIQTLVAEYGRDPVNQLIYEANLSSAEVTAGQVTFTDDVEDLFKGAELYTNPNQSGIQSANFGQSIE